MRALIALAALPLLFACAPNAPESADTNMGHDGASAGAPEALPADDGVTPVIDVRAAWMRPHTGNSGITAAYFVARLDDGAGDRLLEARIDGASRVELHGHTMDENGVMRMRPIDPPLLGPDGPLVFTPGGLHLMVHGLDPVVEGDEVGGVLVFERAGDVPVRFSVRAMPPGQVTEN